MAEVARREEDLHDWQPGRTGSRRRVSSQRQCTRCGLWETTMSRMRPCYADEPAEVPDAAL